MDDEVGARFDRTRCDEIARVVVVARAGLQFEATLEFIIDRAEDAVSLAVLALDRDRRGGRVGRAAELEARNVELFVEVKGEELIAEPAAVVRCDADFLRERVEARHIRSEEHTSELQLLMRISYAVFCLTNKKNTITKYSSHN